MIQSQKTLEFLKKLKDIGHWNDDYDYSEVDYIDNTTKIILFDKKYNSKHLISPSKLISRNTLCGVRNAIDTKDYVIKQYREVHGNTYDYSLLKYNGDTPPSIT